MSKETRQIVLLLILIAAGLIYAYYAYLFTPQWADIQLLKQFRQERQSRYEQLLAYSENGSSLYQEIFDLETKITELQKQIPQTIDKPQLVMDLYTVAKVNQVQPQDVTFGELETRDTYLTQPLTFTCLGSQQGIIKMINDLQQSNHSFTLESLKFTNNEGVFEGEIHLIAYASKVDTRNTETSDGDVPSEERAVQAEQK